MGRQAVHTRLTVAGRAGHFGLFREFYSPQKVWVGKWAFGSSCGSQNKKIPDFREKSVGQAVGLDPKSRWEERMTEDKINQPEKRKFALWISRDTIELAKQHYKDDNCSSASEFIEKAILFYLGYVSSQQNQDYLARVIPATVKGIVDESSNRMGRLLFKMAVELAVIENILAAVCEVDRQELKRLRGQCVEEIKSTNGMISFEQALQWQKE